MASYMATDMQRDARMMPTCQPQHGAYNSSDGCGFYGPQDAPIIDFNGYYLPPHAPRLTAAAIRSSAMAAFHYNPWLHSMHPFNSQAGGGQTWNASHSGAGRTDPSMAPLYHQRVESQLGRAIQQASHASSVSHSGDATMYGQIYQQPNHFQPRHSYPDGRTNHSARFLQDNQLMMSEALAARHSSDATPTTFTARMCQSQYADPSHQQNAANFAEQRLSSTNQYDHVHEQSRHHQVNLQRNAEAFYCPPLSYRQEGHQVTTINEDRQPLDWNQASLPSEYHGYWQSEEMRQDQSQRSSFWPSVPVAGHYEQQQQQQHRHGSHNLHGRAHDSLNIGSMQPEAHASSVLYTDTQALTDAIGRDDSAIIAPPPPSPSTLDKSGVPISSVVSDIIWNACAAFVDPDLLSLCQQRQIHSLDRENVRRRMSSSISMPLSSLSPSLGAIGDSQSANASVVHPKHSRAQTHPSQQQSTLPVLHPLHRLTLGSIDTAANSEESSASSSEPGTPPSSFPAYLYDDLQRAGDTKLPRDEIHLSTLRRMSRFGHDLNSNDNHSSPLLLYRQNSFEQKQDKVIDALGLISPHWKWSAYDEKLMSLSLSRGGNTMQGKSILERRKSFLNTRSSSSGGKGEDIYSSDVGAFGNESSPAFKRFAHQVLAQTLSSPTAVMLALLYSLHIPYMAVKIHDNGDCHLDEEAKEIFAQPPSAAPFKLFTLGLMIANKHLDDNTFLNKTWNEVTGISLVDINKMERWFLERSNYEIVVPQETWILFLQRLGTTMDKKVTSGISKALIPQSKMKHRPSRSLSSTRSSSNSLGGLTQEEPLKRLLLSVEDALTAMGCIATFELEALGNFVSPQRHGAASPRVNMSIYSEPHPRPGHYLQHLHNQSQSAPVLASTTALAGDPMDSDFDVFDEEDGPYRPQRSRHQSSIEKTSSTDLTLGTMFEQNSEEGRQQVQKRQEAGPIDITSRSHRQFGTSADPRAPLAPSILLDLLNRGQQFAHVK